MLAEKKDGRTGADSANAGCLKIFSPRRRSPDRQAPPDQLSAHFPGQNLARRLRAYNLERTSEFAIRPACYSSSPFQEPALHNRATGGVRDGAAPLSRSGVCKAAGPGEIEPGLRSPAGCCLTLFLPCHFLP